MRVKGCIPRKQMLAGTGTTTDDLKPIRKPIRATQQRLLQSTQGRKGFLDSGFNRIEPIPLDDVAHPLVRRVFPRAGP